MKRRSKDSFVRTLYEAPACWACNSQLGRIRQQRPSLRRDFQDQRDNMSRLMATTFPFERLKVRLRVGHLAKS